MITLGQSRQNGFSLIEVILVIILLGALLGLGAGLITEPFKMREDVERRAAMADNADVALQLISREVRAALPNSVVVSNAGNTLTFLRTTTGGRYRTVADGANDNVLNIGQSDNSFEVLGPLSADPTGHCLVIYNVTPPASANCNDANMAPVTGWAEPTLSFQPNTFPFGSPSQRFFIVDAQIAYNCSGGVITRTETPIGGGAPIVGRAASNVVCDGSTFNYADGAASRNALLTVRLTISEAGETISLLHQTHVLNAP